MTSTEKRKKGLEYEEDTNSKKEGQREEENVKVKKRLRQYRIWGEGGR